MTKYRKILRLKGLGFSERNIALSVPCSRNTVSKVLKCAEEREISWPLSDSTTDGDLEKLLSPSAPAVSSKRMSDFVYIHKELLKNGVSKKLLWTEYMEDCRQAGDEALMYSQLCYYIQQDENKRRATMHINRKPAEQVEVDWAGDTAELVDPYTREIVPAYIFVGVMIYSQYAYVEAFPDEKQQSWIDAHVHMYEYFGGVAKILLPDNCKTAVILNGGWKDQRINTVCHEMAEHYGTAVNPARVRTPKDKPNAESTVGNISTWITASLRKEQFFTIAELNAAIRVKLEEFDNRHFQRKEGCRYELFRNEELPLLAPLPAARYELAEWKQATVQFNYHISVDGMLYSIPCEYITVIEVFYHQNRIASRRRLYGRKNQYSTVMEHMLKDHQHYLEWNGDRFRNWAEKIGENTAKVIECSSPIQTGGTEALQSLYGAVKTRRQVFPGKAGGSPIFLILDEWLLIKPTEEEQKDIFELLHRRRKRSSTIFCSQYQQDGWYEQFGEDASPLADAIPDRIVHDAYMIDIIPSIHQRISPCEKYMV